MSNTDAVDLSSTEASTSTPTLAKPEASAKPTKIKADKKAESSETKSAEPDSSKTEEPPVKTETSPEAIAPATEEPEIDDPGQPIDRGLSEKTEEKSKYPKFIKAIHTFQISIDGIVQSYPKDFVISDPVLVQRMLDSKSPVVAVEEEIDFHVCSKCKHRDPIEPILRDKIKAFVDQYRD